MGTETCEHCGKPFSTKGIGNHREACRKRKTSPDIQPIALGSGKYVELLYGT